MSDPSDNKPGKIVNAPRDINKPVAGGRIQQFVGFMWWAMTGLWTLMRLYHTQGAWLSSLLVNAPPDINMPVAEGRAQQFISFMWWAMTGLWTLMRFYHRQGLVPAVNNNNNNAAGDDIGSNTNRGGAQNIGDVNIDANEDRVRAGHNTNDGGDQKIGNVNIARRKSP